MESSFHCSTLLASCWSSYTTFVQLMVRRESVLLFFWCYSNTEASTPAFQFLVLLLSPYPQGYCCLIDLQLGNLRRHLCDSAKRPIQKHFVNLTVNVILI